MSRWIDADALRANINTIFWAEIGKIIESAPSIDIVRCAECKYWQSDGGAMMFCEQVDIPTDANDFCSYGERKESE